MKTISKEPGLTQDVLRQLGPDFEWGVATAAFQIEGSTTADGRGESIWDRFCATPGKVANGDRGDPACDHYRRWQSDLDLIQQLGQQCYRFSIAWPRVQPSGSGAFNPKGLDFYERLVDGLLARGIQPHATLYHWDLPQALQDLGGWDNRDTAQRFADYGAEVVRRLGDRLAALATHNEPWCTAFLGNEHGKFAPGYRDAALARRVGHNLLLSHGLAMQAMRAQSPRCRLGIVLNMSSASAATPADQHEAQRQYAGFVRWFADPLLLGRYPQEPGVLLPDNVQPGDLACIRAPLDFLGVNYYTRLWASREGLPPPRQLGVSDMGWEIYPEGLRELLVGLQREYPLPPLYITENGMAHADHVQEGRVPDAARIDYVRRHLEAVAEAKAEGVDVRGYFYWSLMDNFEWDSGYAKRFGLVHIDYATQQRTLKDSAHWYRDVALACRKAEQHG